MKEKSKRVLYYDLLNIAACIAVIALHHNGLVHTFTGDKIWKECLLVEVGFYWAVPIFLMLSGATLMNYRKKYSTKTFFSKRLSRVVFPWIFWSFVMIAQKIIEGQYTLESCRPKAVLSILLNCEIENVYWFFPVIIGIYMFLPLLSQLAQEQYRKTLWYIVGYGVLVNGTVPLLCEVAGIQWNGSLLSPLNGYYTFFILGYLLSTEDICKKWRIIIYVNGFLCACIRYCGIYYLSFRDGTKNSLLFNYEQVHVFGLAIAVFVLFKYIQWDKALNVTIQNGVSKIAGCSLGVYLIHICVMTYEKKIFHIQESSLWWRNWGGYLNNIHNLSFDCNGCKTYSSYKKDFSIKRKVVANG